MKNYTHLINELFNQPHLVTASYFQTLTGAVADRMNVAFLELNGEKIDAERLKVRAELFNSERPEQRHRFYEIKDGIAIIHIGGTLVHKNGYLHSSSGMTGYDGIKRRIDYAYSDPEVKGVMYVYATPGGHVVGNFELSDYMHSLKGLKPTCAVIDAQACSAGFSLASTADYRYITEHGQAGSVGVLLPHISKEGQLKAQGIKVEIIHAGNHKIDGNPFTDLAPEVREEMQATVSEIYNRFTSSTARNLGIDEQRVIDTQAKVYMGQHAIDVGFADELCTSFGVFDLFKKRIASVNNTTTQNLTTLAQGPTTEGNTTMTEENSAPGELTGAQQKARLVAIMGLGTTLNCSAVATVIALNTEVGEDDAKTILTAVNEQAPVVAETTETTEQSGSDTFVETVAAAAADPLDSESDEEVSGNEAEATQLERVLTASNKAGLKSKI